MAEMSKAHKEALAEGRRQGKAVRDYLEALESTKPKRGRKRTPESMRKQLDKIEAEIEAADPVSRLEMIQKRMDLQAELEAAEHAPDVSGLQADFIAVAKAYSERKGITYAAWREWGVEASVLKAAGISRGS